MGMKYIVLEIKNGDTKREWPIVFPDMMVHLVHLLRHLIAVTV
jgi:hypothetical protein